jgi:transposase
MALFQLTPRARQSLQTIAHSSLDGRQVRRAQALLWLHAGDAVCEVARRLGVNRRTIQRWIKRYEARAAEPVAERVHDRKHPGRSAKQRQRARQIIERVWQRDPRRYGFRALIWTAPMWRCLVHQKTGSWVSLNTIRRALHSLPYRYKRPRLVLARQQATWRQSKGGLNAG